jgi:hypothetical protein
LGERPDAHPKEAPVRKRSLLIAVVVCILALGIAPAAAANEAVKALTNICAAQGSTLQPAFWPPDTLICANEYLSFDPEFDTAERAREGYLAPEKVCLAAGGAFGTLGRGTAVGGFVLFWWGCRFFP